MNYYQKFIKKAVALGANNARIINSDTTDYFQIARASSISLLSILYQIGMR